MFSPNMTVAEAKDVYIHRGVCLFALEPGDGTRYELFIARQGRCIVFGKTNGQACAMAAREGDQINPFSFDGVSEWTRHFLADVFHQITEWSQEHYYDWERKCPIKDGEPIR